jgi:hypothetical protein
MQTYPNLGEREFVSGWTFSGYVPTSVLQGAVESTIKFVGMTPFESSIAREFPTINGNGGHGAMVFQMLTESGIMGNTYIFQGTDGEKHKLTRIILSSCKAYDHQAVGIHLRRKLGLELIRQGHFIL